MLFFYKSKLVVCERKTGVHLPTELVPRCELSIYQPINRWFSHCAIVIFSETTLTLDYNDNKLWCATPHATRTDCSWFMCFSVKQWTPSWMLSVLAQLRQFYVWVSVTNEMGENEMAVGDGREWDGRWRWARMRWPLEMGDCVQILLAHIDRWR